jgi:dephospho-CoA kinase
MLIIGLTGSIGMGKSTAAQILRGFGLPVHNADRAVHDLLKKGGAAVRRVGKLFPAVIRRNAVDRAMLGRTVFHNPRKLRQLEKILHPLVRKTERVFLQKARRRKSPAVILEIPLLFETGAEKRCDLTLCVTAPKAVQKKRVLKRPGMTEAKFRAILKCQMPDREKRRRVDYVIGTGKSVADTRRQLQKTLEGLGLRV